MIDKFWNPETCKIAISQFNDNVESAQNWNSCEEKLLCKQKSCNGKDFGRVYDNDYGHRHFSYLHVHDTALQV